MWRISHQWKFIASRQRSTEQVYCHGNSHGYGALLLIMAGQMLMTSSNPDTQACSLWLRMCVVQMPLSEMTSILSCLPPSEIYTFHCVLHTAMSSTGLHKSVASCMPQILTDDHKPYETGISLICSTCYTDQWWQFLHLTVRGWNTG